MTRAQAALLGSRKANHPRRFDRAYIRELYSRGLSCREVAAVVGCHFTLVSRYVRDLADLRAESR